MRLTLALHKPLVPSHCSMTSWSHGVASDHIGWVILQRIYNVVVQTHKDRPQIRTLHHVRCDVGQLSAPFMSSWTARPAGSCNATKCDRGKMGDFILFSCRSICRDHPQNEGGDLVCQPGAECLPRLPPGFLLPLWPSEPHNLDIIPITL